MNGKVSKIIRKYATARGFRYSKCKKAWLSADPDTRKIMLMEAMAITAK